MSVVIIKYNAGNIQSVLYALERIGMEASVTDDHSDIRNAEKVIFPGVGEASTAMKYLKDRGLDSLIKNLEQPVLGICLGMQLMCAHSEENNTECLGIFDEMVKWFKTIPFENGLSKSYIQSAKSTFKIPQIGWNNIYHLKTSLFKGIEENSFCYFVHGYFAVQIAGLFGVPIAGALTVFDWIAVVLFSALILFDFNRAMRVPRTLDNSIDCAVGIYLDILNLFIHLLRLVFSSAFFIR